MKKSHTLVLLLSFSLFIFDYFAKWLAVNYLKNPIEITSWFRLTYSENTGIAWSLPIPHEILIPLNLFLLALIVYLGFKHLDLRKNISKISLALIIGGAFGNIYDRLTQGYVIDFISVGSWPIFNLADTFLSIGLFLLILFYGKIKRSSK